MARKIKMRPRTAEESGAGRKGGTRQRLTRTGSAVGICLAALLSSHLAVAQESADGSDAAASADAPSDSPLVEAQDNDSAVVTTDTVSEKPDIEATDQEDADEPEDSDASEPAGVADESDESEEGHSEVSAGGDATAGEETPAEIEDAPAPETAAGGGPSPEELKQANNPIAHMVTFNLHDYYRPQYLGTPDFSTNQMLLRFAMPVGPALVRVSMPFNTQAVAGDVTSGIGDVSIFAAFTVTRKTSPILFGVGPLYQAPTSYPRELGTEHHELGGVASGLFATDEVLVGGLVTYQHSVDSDPALPDSSLMVVQPFAMFQVGQGYYLRTSPLWVFDFETGDNHIPFGFGAGKVLKVGNVVYNFFIEPQYTVFASGVSQPGFQLYSGLNMQFSSGNDESSKKNAAQVATLGRSPTLMR